MTWFSRVSFACFPPGQSFRFFICFFKNQVTHKPSPEITTRHLPSPSPHLDAHNALGVLTPERYVPLDCYPHGAVRGCFLGEDDDAAEQDVRDRNGSCRTPF